MLPRRTQPFAGRRPEAAGAEPLLAHRNLILGLLILLAAASWALLIWQTTVMDMDATGPTMGMAAPFFLVVCVVMMIAMMFPTAAPMILTFHQVQARRRHQGAAFVSTWIFVAAYLAVWTVAGIVAFAAAVLAEDLARSATWSAPTFARIGGAMLVIAGVYQLSPLKHVCLAKCRSPLAFIMSSWRDGTVGAVRMGLEHGLYCLGCCWLLFVILFPLGIMNIAAMAVVTLLIFAEKTLPSGARIAAFSSVALALYGIVVIAVPATLPTSAPGRSMSHMNPNTAPVPSEKMSSMPGMAGK